MKECRKCGEVKPLVDFPAGRNTCKACKNERNREWVKRNRALITEKQREYRRRNADSCKKRDRCWHLRKTYGISLQGFEDLLAGQGGTCALCTSTTDLVVDHNHSTGEIRGILCRSCNSGIGQLGDNPTQLRRAALYLEERGHYG